MITHWKSNRGPGQHPASGGAGFNRKSGTTLVEIVIGMALFSVTAVSLLGGVSFGFRSAQMARQNLRATQILLEKMEVIRLYSWEQLTTSGYVPDTFTAAFESDEGSSSDSKTSKRTKTPQGSTEVSYQGTITISDPPLTENYSSKLKLVTVEVTWVTGHTKRSRKLSTLIAFNGLNTSI